MIGSALLLFVGDTGVELLLDVGLARLSGESLSPDFGDFLSDALLCLPHSRW